MNKILEEIGNIAKKIGEKGKEVYIGAKEKTEEYLARPDVQEKIEKAKNKTIEIAEKGVDSLKKWLKPEK